MTARLQICATSDLGLDLRYCKRACALLGYVPRLRCSFMNRLSSNLSFMDKFKTLQMVNRQFRGTYKLPSKKIYE